MWSGLAVSLLLLATIIIITFIVCKVSTRRKTVDLVVSRYAEDLDWMHNFDLSSFRRIIIYNKGPTVVVGAPKTAKIIELPNVGRCDHTYLYHIVTNYDSLADVTVFLVASCSMDFKWKNAVKTVSLALQTRDSVFVGSLHKNVATDLAEFKLDEWKASEGKNAELNPETKLMLSPDRPFGVWFKKNFGDVHIGAVVYHGIFAVSKQHIKQRSLASYKTLIKYVDGHSNPEAGHYFERAWLAVFGPVGKNCIYT